MPAGSVLRALPAGAGVAVVRDGPATLVGAWPDRLVVADGAEALAALDGLAPGLWMGFLGYDLGRAIEPFADLGRPGPPVPDLVLGRFPAHVVLEPGRAPRVEGTGEARERLARALADAATAPADDDVAVSPTGAWTSSIDRVAFERAVRTAIELERAGECYQLNLTRTLTLPTALPPRALHAALAAHNPAPYAALIELAGVAVVSASPERFLRVDGARVETRPIKGTARDAASLRASEKDHAENVMIVDLARNDLGRVCEPGSIHVPALCELEAHPGLHHLVSTVVGRRRHGVGWGELARATFPPASVTGAPKPRVLAAIEELEPVRRGPYCGAVGWIDTTTGSADLAVAIRTFTVAGGTTGLGVGAGITVGSDPAAEWAETELKAARLLEAAGVVTTVGAPAGIR